MLNATEDGRGQKNKNKEVNFKGQASCSPFFPFLLPEFGGGRCSDVCGRAPACFRFVVFISGFWLILTLPCLLLHKNPTGLHSPMLGCLPEDAADFHPAQQQGETRVETRRQLPQPGTKQLLLHAATRNCALNPLLLHHRMMGSESPADMLASP